MTNLNDFELFYKGISNADTPSEMLYSWSLMGLINNNYKIALSFPKLNRNWNEVNVSKIPQTLQKFICPYFQSDKLMFIDNSVYSEFIRNKTSQTKVMNCLYLDSNISTYIGTLFNRGNIKKLDDNLGLLLNEIIVNKINFDYIFYLLENLKHIPRAEISESP